jgi:hypothetical protein
VKTVRNGNVEKLTLRLVETGKKFFGLIFAGNIEKRRIEGDEADDVWQRLHDDLRPRDRIDIQSLIRVVGITTPRRKNRSYNNGLSKGGLFRSLIHNS